MQRRFLDRFAANLAQEPDRAFVHYYATVDTPESLSFGGLGLRAREFGGVLRAQTSPGELLFIISDDPLRQVVWWLGALLAGLTPGILTPPTPKLDRTKYFRDLSVVLEKHRDAHVLADDALASAEFAAVISAERRIEPGRSAQALTTFERAETQAPLIFQQSSGTTGIRKGVLLSEQAVVRQLAACGNALSLRDDDTIVSWLPLYHDMGLVGCLMQAVYAGVPLVLTSPFTWLQHPEWLFQAIQRHRGTLCWLPNFAFNVLADRVPATNLAADCLSSLRAVISCSEPVIASSLEKFQRTFTSCGLQEGVLSSSYALAENTFAATQSLPGRGVTIETVRRSELESDGIAIADPQGIKIASSGAPVPNTEVRVRRGETVCADGEVGDIELHSDCLFDGYFGIGADQPPFAADGWYRTGDYGYQRGGELFVLGRKNDLIIRAGRNINPADLERALENEAEIKPGRVAAFGVFNEEEGTEDVVVLAEFAAARVSDLDAVGHAAHERLASEVGLAPQRVEIVRPNWLVKSSSGKISRAACRKKYLETIERRKTPRIWLTEYADNIDETLKDSFRTFGAEAKIRTPTQVLSPGRISLGNWVSLGRHGKILMQTDFSAIPAMARQHYPEVAHEFDPRTVGPRAPYLKIGDGTSIGDYFFISCACSIEIGRHVLFSDRVFISDSNHLYDNPDLPIVLQSNSVGRPIVIEDHAWIGINVVILEGVRIGRHAIVSASSVVTRDVPPYTVVAGNPAQVVRAIAGRGPSSQREEKPVAATTGLAESIVAHLRHEVGAPVTVDQSLFKSGLLDSLATLRLLVFIEQTHGLRLESEQLFRQEADSVAAICALAGTSKNV